MRDQGIADRLRAAGLHVIEVDGWQSRGSDSFNPRGSTDHHTVSNPPANAPSLNICIHGRSDLPGPLCNVLQARDNTMYVIAAGTANHAGSGGWKGLSGNSSVYGIERENMGTTAEPWRPDQFEAACQAHAALIQGRAGADMVMRHAEWTSRKIDTHSVNGDDLRARVDHYLHGGGAAPPIDMSGAIDMLMYLKNPNRPEELWAFDGMYKRFVKSMDEIDVVKFTAGLQGVQRVGEGSMGAADVSMAAWASIPVAPGTEWNP